MGARDTPSTNAQSHCKVQPYEGPAADRAKRYPAQISSLKQQERNGRHELAGDWNRLLGGRSPFDADLLLKGPGHSTTRRPV
jgi:hypothetical protein